MRDFFDIAFWICVVLLVAVVADFVRLVILRIIWNRRHAAMVAKLKRQAIIEER